eukprot:4777913-Heterocapsa_arctica.AAC.1
MPGASRSPWPRSCCSSAQSPLQIGWPCLGSLPDDLIPDWASPLGISIGTPSPPPLPAAVPCLEGLPVDLVLPGRPFLGGLYLAPSLALGLCYHSYPPSAQS